MIALPNFKSFIALSNDFLLTFSPRLTSSYPFTRTRRVVLLAVMFGISSLQYVLWETNSRSPLSSLWIGATELQTTETTSFENIQQ